MRAKIEGSYTAEIDVETLAEAFWSLSDVEQGAFFVALYRITSSHYRKARDEKQFLWALGDEYGSGQWRYMAEVIRELPKADDRLHAANMVRALAADFYLFTLGEPWDWERSDGDVARNGFCYMDRGGESRACGGPMVDDARFCCRCGRPVSEGVL